MYSVKAVIYRQVDGSSVSEEILIHDNASPMPEHHLIDPKLKIADTSAGTFTATMPPSNPGYYLIERFTSTIKVYKEQKLIWTGRVLSESIDFWNRRSITCEGALAYLNDTVQPLRWYGSIGRNVYYILYTILDKHNQKVDDRRKLYVGTVDGFDEYDYGSYDFQTNNGTSWEELNINILDRFNCHLAIHYEQDKAYVDLYSDYPNTATQQINFGDNLLNFTRDWNLLDLTTVILPRGEELDVETPEGQSIHLFLKNDDKTEGHNPISDGTYSIGNVSGAITVRGDYIINNALYEQYGRVERVVDFSDCITTDDLFIMAKYYIACTQFDELVLKVNAVDLHMLTKTEVSFNLLDEVYCESIPHGLYGQYFPISEIDIPLDKPENTTYTMTRSSVSSGLTGSLTSFKSSINSSFKNIRSTSHILNLAKIEASSIINRKTTGYVSVVNMFDNEEEGVAQAVVISNNPEWKKASKYWIWNMNGLAYYSAARSEQIGNTIGTSNVYPFAERDGYNFETPRYYDVAITMDGTIVANHIKTGILSDGMGYNYWNLETGEFSLQPNTRFQYGGPNEYTSLHDLVYGVDKAGKKKSGATNYLDGAKDWAGWEYSSSWAFDGENAINEFPGNGSNWLHSKKNSIDYRNVKGYTMTFSIEGCMINDSEWGDINGGNAFIVTFGLWRKNSQYSQYSRVAYIDRLFSFDYDYTRRYVSVDLVNDNFNIAESNWSDSDVYLRITLSNSSSHAIAIRRPQLEHGNTPTDWSTSEADIDQEAENKATTAYNASIVVAETYARTAQSNAITEAGRLSSNVFTEAKNLIHNISGKDRTYSDGILNAFQQSLYHEEILRRLTNNYADDGLYMYDNKIYMNATRIRSGSIDTALLKVGVIHDQLGNNKWDLTTGYFESRNGFFKGNIEATGSVMAGNDYGGSILLKNGEISGYWNGRYAGSITTGLSSSSESYMNNKPELRLSADFLTIDSDCVMWKRGNNSYSTIGAGVTEYSNMPYISKIRDIGNGDIEWTTSYLSITIENGLVANFSMG